MKTEQEARLPGKASSSLCAWELTAGEQRMGFSRSLVPGTGEG